jgi:hypothetical protein
VESGDDHIAFERGETLVVVNRGSTTITMRDGRSHRWGAGSGDGYLVEVGPRAAAVFAGSA